MSKIKKELIQNKLFLADKHPKWKGGLKHSSKYILEYCPTHPFNKDKYYPQHRLVMEKHLGRILDKKEVVHHIDGDPSNNDIHNLMIFSDHSEHLKFHCQTRCNDNVIYRDKFGKFSKLKKGCMPR